MDFNKQNVAAEMAAYIISKILHIAVRGPRYEGFQPHEIEATLLNDGVDYVHIQLANLDYVQNWLTKKLSTAEMIRITFFPIDGESVYQYHHTPVMKESLTGMCEILKGEEMEFEDEDVFEFQDKSYLLIHRPTGWWETDRAEMDEILTLNGYK